MFEIKPRRLNSTGRPRIMSAIVDALKVMPFYFCNGIKNITENQIQKEHAGVRTRHSRSMKQVL